MTYEPHDGENKPRAERCCDAPEIETARGLGTDANYIVSVYCSTCGHDFMSIWPKGSLHDDGWPKDWTRPPTDQLASVIPTEGPEGETLEDWIENRGIDTFDPPVRR